MRTFEFSEGTSNKFWTIKLSGKKFTVNFGKIGTAGQTQLKEFADAAAARKEHDKLVAEKLKKGYRETTKAAPAAPAAAAKTATPAKAKKATPAKAVKPATAAKAAPSGGGKRTFEFSDGSSNKFWTIKLSGKKFTVNFGKIGTAGQTQLKEFADAAAVRKEHDKLVAEKLKKGYKETT